MKKLKHVVGDIHGHYSAFLALSQHLGYLQTENGLENTEASLVFCGDLIDRGPGQVELLTLVKQTCDAGNAICCLGNHELNALGYVEPNGYGDFLREHSETNVRNHQAFLSQVGTQGQLAWLEWFRTLPLWLDCGEFRVVHACWHDPSIQRIQDATGKAQPCLNDFDESRYRQALDKTTKLGASVERLLKGPEAKLPVGYFFETADGTVKDTSRLQWWDAHTPSFFPETFWKEGAGVIEGVLYPNSLGESFGYDSDVPLFIGHYWLKGQPSPLLPNLACLDYSIAKKGKLVAYEWDGQTPLTAEQMKFVPNS